MAEWDEAWAEAEASCPVDAEQFDTIELQHPAFVDDASNPIALRFVLDVQPRSLGIELSASFTPGQMATFEPTAMEIQRPEYAEGRVPVARLSIDDVAGEILPYLEAATDYAADLVVIFRSYRSDDTSAPSYGPVEMVLTDITVDGSRVEGTATISDFGDMSVPSLVYRADDFPGLQA